MSAPKEFLDQIIAGTKVDRHGEKLTKEFFQGLIERLPSRVPLNQHHDMRLETLGYLENLRLVPCVDEPDEWNVIADIYITSESVDEALRGFSFSAMERIGGCTDSPLYHIHLPFPVYNDSDFIDELIESDQDLMVEKWIKKSVDPVTIGLISTGIALILSPEWDIQYKRRVRPIIKRALKQVPKLLSKNVTPDLVQHVVGRCGETIKLYFVPDRKNVTESFREEYFIAAIAAVKDFLEHDEKSQAIGVDTIKLYFNPNGPAYLIFHIQYLDGFDQHVA